MADARLAAAPPAQLPDRRARRALRLGRGRDGAARTVPDAARRRHEAGNARRAAVTEWLPSALAGERLKSGNSSGGQHASKLEGNPCAGGAVRGGMEGRPI